MDKLKMQTPDLIDKNIEQIAMLFPNVITEIKDESGNPKKAVDFDLLKQALSKNLVEGDDERYRLDWQGKKASLLKANTPISKTLRPCREESVNFDTTQNLYIEGDNFEVLKILQESYLGKVKMIYIDPPYNRKKGDLIYKDDFREPVNEYDLAVGAVDDNGYKMFKNTDTNGRFHSDWLSMMYERLLIARDLLKEDGVLFISIDDNEVHNLKKICDEVFGEENFIGEYIKQSKVGGGSDTKYIVKEHEYCIVYGKEIERLNEMFIEHDEGYLKRYKEQDSTGKFFWDTFARPGLSNPIIYEIKAPDGTVIKNGWIRSKERFEKEYADGDIRIIKKNNGEWSVQFKQYLNESGKKPRSLTMEFGGTIEGKNEIIELFNNDKMFLYPKSSFFIKELLKTLSCSNNIILDFFSGSATTAHAVMQLNAEDGGNRKFIMVQLPEPCNENSEAAKFLDSIGKPKNIAEIGKERIRRAGQKILKELEKKDDQLDLGQDKIDPSKLDIGFRVYKVDSTNMKDIFYHPSKLKQDELDLVISNIKEDRYPEDLLTQVILDLGLEISLPIETRKILNNTVFIVQTNSLAACFDNNIDFQIVDTIADLKPLKVVFKDNSFKDDKDRINVEERFKRLSPETIVTVI